MASVSKTRRVWSLALVVALCALHTATAEPESKPCGDGGCPTSTPGPGWVMPDSTRAGQSVTPAPRLPPAYVSPFWGGSGGSYTQRVYYVPQIACYITGYVPQQYPPPLFQPMPPGTGTDTVQSGSGSDGGMQILPHPFPYPQAPAPSAEPLGSYSFGQGGQTGYYSGGQQYYQRPAVQPTPSPTPVEPTTGKGSHGSSFGSGAGSSGGGRGSNSMRGRSHSEDSQLWRSNY